MPVLGSFLSHTGGRHGYHSLFSSSSSLPYGRYGGGAFTLVPQDFREGHPFWVSGHL